MGVSVQEMMKNEKKVLAPYACKNIDSRGREYEEAADSNRLPFQKDRDRIIHCRAFRRLHGKTQVFVAHHGDHYRNRLTHSLEAAQIARDMARSLRLNEDLAESISLAHDLGHTPFGHSGEHALNDVMQQFEMHFEHNEQSKRIVEVLEDIYPNFPGLNLTYEVREGLMKHQTAWDNAGQKILVHPTLEAQLVNLADEIAYNNHDVDDGLRAGYLTEEDLNGLELWRIASERVKRSYKDIASKRIRWSRTVSKMIGILIESAVMQTSENLKVHKIRSLGEVYGYREKLVMYEPHIGEQLSKLRELLMEKMYFHPDVQGPMKEGQDLITRLFRVYYKRPHLMGDAERFVERDGLEVTVKDYLAGMTDGFAIEEAERVL